MKSKKVKITKEEALFFVINKMIRVFYQTSISHVDKTAEKYMKAFHKHLWGNVCKKYKLDPKKSWTANSKTLIITEAKNG